MKLLKKIAVVVFIIAVAASAAQAFDVTLNATVSTSIRSDYQWWHAGSTELSQVSNNGVEERPILLFDINSLDPSRSIAYAEVVLSFDNYAGGDGPIQIYQITTPWSVTDYTPSWVNPWQNPGGDFTGVGIDNQLWNGGKWAGAPCWFNVTDIVSSWKSGAAQNYGFIIKTSDTATDWVFQKDAVMNIYYMPVPEPGSMLALITSMVSLAGFVIRRKK